MVTALALAALLATSADQPAPPAPAAEGAGLVLVRGGGWYGSGVVWDAAARTVLTALHVVEEMPPEGIEVVLAAPGPEPLVLRARLVDREPRLDLALLEVQPDAGAELGPSPALGRAGALSPGEPVTLGGCAGGRCARTPAAVLAPARHFGGARYLALAAAAAPGCSGGAVLDAQGALVGIVDLTLAREPGVALAVPVEGAAVRFPRG